MSAGQPSGERVTPRAAAALERNAGCVVKGCPCIAFAFLELTDGFRICECLHTQIGHER